MHILRIFRPSPIRKPKVRGRRTQSERPFQLESLETRTALSGGLDVGFASALSWKPPQFGPADVSLATSIDSAIQQAIARNSTFPLSATGWEFAEGVHDGSLSAAGDPVPSSPVTVEAVESIVGNLPTLSQLTPPPPPPPPPAGTFASGASLTFVMSEAQVEHTLLRLNSTFVVADGMGLDVSESLYTVSRDSQNNVSAFDPNTGHTYPLDGAIGKLFTTAFPESEDFFPPPPAPPGSTSMTWPNARLQLTETTINSIGDPDISILGSLISPDSHDSSSSLMMESATGRACGPGVGLIVTGLSTQMDLGTDSSGSGWMSYVATGGSVVPDGQSSVFRGDLASAPDDMANEPSTSAAITAGEVPLSILLSGPDTPAQTDSDRLEQVAELSPLEESSLALVATLWTVSSDPATAPPQRAVEPAGGDMEPGATLASPPSWTIFVTGLNEAFEQSQRDVEQAFFSSRGQPIVGARAPAALDKGLLWQGPILPATEQGSFDGAEKNQQTEAVRPSLSDAGETYDRGEDAPARSGEQPAVVVASVPTISVVSAFGAIAGWLWTQRKRWERSRPGRNGRGR